MRESGQEEVRVVVCIVSKCDWGDGKWTNCGSGEDGADGLGSNNSVNENVEPVAVDSVRVGCIRVEETKEHGGVDVYLSCAIVKSDLGNRESVETTEDEGWGGVSGERCLQIVKLIKDCGGEVATKIE